MEIEYFIGIVPPEDYLKRIVKFQNKWMEQIRVEPHVTLKAQGGLTLDKKWINKVRKVCQDFPPFSLALSQPRFFGVNILYLSVQSTLLYELHEKLVREISPSDQLIQTYFELVDFVPHLTLGKEGYGVSKQDLQDMKLSVEKELTPYRAFEVDFIRIYEKKREQHKYERLVDIDLEGQSEN
ncbi:2'-5' RNA ligase family protein [Halobacillus rhizosphaerae]|uniref:2'-5' RNA ligase family protein n=1 Tax=Halobacillus rhizosphaerae TaxID=3064889 RepID=UPI00398B5221